MNSHSKFYKKVNSTLGPLLLQYPRSGLCLLSSLLTVSVSPVLVSRLVVVPHQPLFSVPGPWFSVVEESVPVLNKDSQHKGRHDFKIEWVVF